jgi:hypothetical protein
LAVWQFLLEGCIGRLMYIFLFERQLLIWVKTLTVSYHGLKEPFSLTLVADKNYFYGTCHDYIFVKDVLL